MTQVRYETWTGGEGIPSQRFCREVLAVAARTGAKRLCDIGAGANPLLDREEARASGIEDYVLTDISAAELEKAPAGFEKVVADVTAGPRLDLGPFDLIVSHTVAEHVKDAERLHRSVQAMLAPGGSAMHFFPTFYEPVFLANRVIPEGLGESILGRLQDQREKEGDHGKFPALYRWCRGPTPRQLRRLEACGYEVESYVGVFGHGYFDKFKSLARLEWHLAEALRRHPVPALTAYAWVQLRRPA